MSRSMKDFGRYLRRAREKAGISQYCLGVALGFSTGQLIYEIETGRRRLPMRHARKTAEMLGLDESDLVRLVIETECSRMEESANG